MLLKLMEPFVLLEHVGLMMVPATVGEVPTVTARVVVFAHCPAVGVKV